jgi:hypothetical protein
MSLMIDNWTFLDYQTDPQLLRPRPPIGSKTGIRTMQAELQRLGTRRDQGRTSFTGPRLIDYCTMSNRSLDYESRIGARVVI